MLLLLLLLLLMLLLLLILFLLVVVMLWLGDVILGIAVGSGCAGGGRGRFNG